MATEKTFNMNTWVRITLTKHGADILNAQNLALKKAISATINVKTDYKDGDEFGDTLWQVMNIFGGDKCCGGALVSFSKIEFE